MPPSHLPKGNGHLSAQHASPTILRRTGPSLRSLPPYHPKENGHLSAQHASLYTLGEGYALGYMPPCIP